MNCAARTRLTALNERRTVENSPWNNEGETYPRIKKKKKHRERERERAKREEGERESPAEKGERPPTVFAPEFRNFHAFLTAGYISSPADVCTSPPLPRRVVSSVSCKWSTAVGWIPAGKAVQVWGCPPNSSWIVIQSRPAKRDGKRTGTSRSGARSATINRRLRCAVSGLLIPRRQFIAGLRVLGAAKAHAARRRCFTYVYVGAAT